ncbi:MAG TPA: hypothetical protein VNO30_22265 [Kofleriaceae bacterium]|nr:hypothetical protein [Kofleriaceae bacterium]
MKKLALGWMVLLCLGLGLHGACSDDDGGGMTGDGTFGATCVSVVDTGSSECDSGVCTDTFDQIGHPVCSQKCTPGDGSTCPAGSEGQKCNMRGYCKP